MTNFNFYEKHIQVYKRSMPKHKTKYSILFKYNNASFEGVIIETLTSFNWTKQICRNLDPKTLSEVIFYSQLIINKLTKTKRLRPSTNN